MWTSTCSAWCMVKELPEKSKKDGDAGEDEAKCVSIYSEETMYE